jgi:hypothetical protein
MFKNIILIYFSFFSSRRVLLSNTMKRTTVSELLTCRWIQEISKNNLNHETAWKWFFVWTVILWLITNWPNFVEKKQNGTIEVWNWIIFHLIVFWQKENKKELKKLNDPELEEIPWQIGTTRLLQSRRKGCNQSNNRNEWK